MLKRLDNEIEIWSDIIEKETVKKYYIIAIAGMVFFLILTIIVEPDFSIKETYYVLGLELFPCFFLLICAFISKRKNSTPRLIAKINREYIEFYDKKNTKQIKLQQITKINRVSSKLGPFLAFFYNENEKEKKYSIFVSPANINLVVMAVKEYKENVQVKDIRIR